jgi:hypothetical protein
MALNFLSEVRERHHATARLIASGRSVAEVARLASTSESKLNRMLCDPAFRNLISRYRKAESQSQANLRFNLLAAA